MAADVTLTPRRVAAARTGDLVVFGVSGFAMASWMSRIPDIKQILHLTPGTLSLLLLAVSAGSLVGLPLAGRLAHRYGAVTVVRMGMGTAMTGELVAAIAVQFSGSPWWVVPGLLFVGLGNGTWDVAQNLEGTRIETALTRAIMPWFHAAFSGGTVIAALIGAGLTALRVPVLLHIGVAVALSALAVLWGTSKFLPTHGDENAHGDGTKPAVRSAWLEPRTLLVGVIVLAAAFAEGTANDWMAVAFVDGHHLSNAMGVVAFASFLVFMTAGRILGTRLLDLYGRVVVLRILFGMAILGCALVVFGPTWLAFIGTAIWGIGASLGFPVGMSAAADDPARAPMRLSVVATIGYTAFLAGPPFLGFLGDHVGVLRALVVVGAVSLIAILIVPVTKPQRPQP